MANKKKVQQQRMEQPAQKKEPNFWKITAIIALILLAGVTAKNFYTPKGSAPITTIQPATAQPVAIQPNDPQASDSVEDQVLQVAVNFKCACGGCGELPLAECLCDMPRGAVEEKSFIRTKLREGFSVPQVIELLDDKYGHKTT